MTYGAQAGDPRDSIFLTQLKIITDKYNCKIKDINLDLKIVDIDCPGDMTQECALELTEVFEKYLD